MTVTITKEDWNRLRKKATLLGKRKAVRMSRLPKLKRRLRVAPVT
jgi:hypothetical protein